jgi:hypothetical protein
MLHYLLLLLELFSQGRAPIDSSRVGASNSAEQCKGCHLAQYAEWRSSRHSQAWTNDFFQFDYQKNKKQWCRNCHIPLQAQQQSDAVALRLREEGVNCITCHVRGDVFLAKTKRKDSPHNTQTSSDFGNDSFCEGCHQFNFPVFGQHNELVRYTDEPMQNTVEQFRSGRFAKTHTCRDCHANTPGKHGYAGAHDLGMLQQALRFDACRKGNEITTTLTNVGAGHNVPTGDVHRHILVKVWQSTAPAKLKQAFYGRRFKPLGTGGKTTIWDSTLPPNTYRRFRVDAAGLGSDAEEEVNLEVVYLYGSNESYRPPFKEPASTTVYRLRKRLSQLPSCEK